jgi:hypothetical protein
MPRKSKIEELRKWVSEYKTFVFELEYPAYKVKISVLSDTETNAEVRANELYPDAVNFRLLGQTHKTHI